MVTLTNFVRIFALFLTSFMIDKATQKGYLKGLLSIFGLASCCKGHNTLAWGSLFSCARPHVAAPNLWNDLPIEIRNLT